MGYASYLNEMLRPLGVYDLQPGSLSRSELDALGEGLDGLSRELERVETECNPVTACSEGLDRWESLFARTPAHYSTAYRRRAVAALLSVTGDSFTLSDINWAIYGCGISAIVREKGDYGQLRVIFPNTVGIPRDFDRIRDIILDIIPCHLETEFFFRYLIWWECHFHQYTWFYIHRHCFTWMDFMTAV